MDLEKRQLRTEAINIVITENYEEKAIIVGKSLENIFTRLKNIQI